MIKRKNIYLFLLLITLLAIGTLSLISLGKLPPVKVNHLDKIEHFIAYFVVTTLCFQTLVYNRWGFLYRNRYISSWFFCWSFGSIMEVAQLYFTHHRRQFDLYDMAANTLGVTLALVLCYFNDRRKKMRVGLMG